MSPHLPITPDEIAESAIGAAKAGAAIVHLHARDPEDGKPVQDPDLFRQFLPRIKAVSDVIVNLTTGGSQTMTVEERLQPALQLQPGSRVAQHGDDELRVVRDAAALSVVALRVGEPYLAGTEAGIFKNTLKDIADILQACSGNGTRFELECYDIGHLYTAAHFLDRGLVQPPLFIQSVFGIRGGIGPHPEDVLHMKRTADRLFGDDYQWSVVGAGRHQMFIAVQSAVFGGHVRVGLEDSLWIGKGQLATSNDQQVAKIRRILGELGLDVATPDEARQILELKGRHTVSFSPFALV